MNRICHITSAHPPEDIRIFKKECVSLAKAGFDVYLVQRGESYEKEGVHIIGFGNVCGGRIKRFSYYSYKAYKLALDIDADLYHIHDPELLPYAMLFLLKGKKVIFDSHEIYFYQILTKEYIPILLRKFVSRAYHVLETIICRRIDGVIACAYVNGKNTFENRSKSITMIFNYPILDKFFPEVSQIEIKDNICFVGRISRERGIPMLAKTSNEIDIKLVLAGKFSDEILEKEIMSFKNIKYYGMVDQNKIRSIINNSFCGACIFRNVGQHSYMEAFPTKVLEYLACGVPVILNNNKFNIEFIKNNRVGLVIDPDNKDEVGKAIMYLYKNPDIAKQMGELGRKIVVDKYSWQSQEKKLINFYNQILKEG